ncbi:MAG: hypothetical protein AB7V40_01855 [Methyloceanibacter sp.]
MLRVHVDTHSGYGGVEVPLRFRLDGREVEAVETLDQWTGRSDRYFKVRAGDGSMYILRFDEKRSEWELIMFQSPEAQAVIAPAKKRRPLANGLDR